MSTQTRNTPSRNIDAEIGRRAHLLMWDGKRKQREVAALMGITADGLGRKLKGERGWAMSEVVAIAGVLNTTVAYLVGESDSPNPVGPAGIEPTTSTVKAHRFAPIVHLADRRAS